MLIRVVALVLAGGVVAAVLNLILPQEQEEIVPHEGSVDQVDVESQVDEKRS